MTAARKLVSTSSPQAEPAAATGIDIRGLTKRFTMGRRSVEALAAVDLGTVENSFLSLLGPSGCGKSTILRILAGPGGADVRHRADQRPLDARDPARPRARHRLPGGGAAAVAQRHRQHPAAARGRRDHAVAGPRRRADRARRPHRLREGQARAAVRWHAPAGGDRALPRGAADGAAPRRALRRAGRHDPPTPQRRAAAHLDRAARDHADGHPRHRGGGLPLRRRRGDEPPARAGSPRSWRSTCRARAVPR